MSSTKRPFTKNAQCPVVNTGVVLSGVLVELAGGPSAVAHKSCSNVEKCLAAHGSLENLPNCLLHNLQP